MPRQSKVAVGFTAGVMTVTEEAGSMNHRKYWYAECTKCGQLHLLSGQQLVRNGYAESCGKCPIDDLTGNTYERLTVRKYSHKRNDKHYWLCDCSCGNEHVVQAGHLKDGRTKSCGCLARELAQERNLVHGGMLNGTPTPEYTAWFNLRHQGVAPYPDDWEDFRQFIKDVGFRPGDTYRLHRHDLREPHGLNNTYWRNTDEEREQQRSLGLSTDCAIDMSTVG